MDVALPALKIVYTASDREQSKGSTYSFLCKVATEMQSVADGVAEVNRKICRMVSAISDTNL